MTSSNLHDLMAFPFRCPNCSAVFDDDQHLFCSGRCEDEASLVRYRRACRSDGRYRQKDVREQIEMRIARLLGGYSDRARTVPARVRRLVFERDRHLCRSCNAPGKEVDHIAGNSSELWNLQLLCPSCHDAKTRRAFRLIPPEDLEAEHERRAPLVARFDARQPLRLSDDPILWPNLSRQIKKARREISATRRLRRSGRRCPVCLGTLPRNEKAVYRRIGEKHARHCNRCDASRWRDIFCSACGAEAVWRNETLATCQACAVHGTVESIVASPPNRLSFRSP